MNLPSTEEQLSCILHRLADEGKFTFKIDGHPDPMPIQIVHSAIEEVTRAIQEARESGDTPSPCVRLMGLLFVNAVEHDARTRPEPLVTISETDPC
jgi:hypothetical protein